MSVKESKLSDYGYHMVTAVTESTCNAQLRQFLMDAQQSNTVYYLDNGEHEYFQVTESTRASEIPDVFPVELRKKAEDVEKAGSSIFKELQKLKLFDVKSGSGVCVTDGMSQAYYDWYLAYAFYIEDGIPQYLLDEMIEKRRKDPSYNPDNLFKIIEFQEKGDRVNFNQRFRNLSIVELYENRGLHFTKTEQPSDASWTFRFDIQLNFIKGSYSNLPEDVRNRIEALSKVTDPSMLFEISTLVMDMQTLSTLATPVIDGVSNKARELIETDIIAGYFDRLEKANGTIFCHALSPSKKHNTFKYLFAPTSYTFTVDKGTLNYLVMFDDQALPEIKHTSWSWLESGEPYHGVMSINRDKIVTILLNEFVRTVIPCIKKKISTGIKVSAKSTEYYHSFESAPIDRNDKFVLGEGNVYTYQYDSHADSGKKIILCIADTRFKADYYLKCNAVTGTMTSNGVTYPSINITARISASADFMYDSEHSKGTYFDKEIEYQLGIMVCSDGNIKFIKNCVERDKHPAGIGVSEWSQFCTFGGIREVVKGMESDINDIVEKYKTASENTFLSGYRTNCNWVMPGNGTFTYRDERFSDGLDFYTHIDYVQEA